MLCSWSLLAGALVLEEPERAPPQAGVSTVESTYSATSSSAASAELLTADVYGRERDTRG